MSVPADLSKLLEAKALRDTALAILQEDIAELKEDLERQSIAERAKEQVTGQVHDALNHAREVAGDNKPIVILILAALTAWFARKPIGGLWHKLFGEEEDDTDGEWDEDEED